MSNEPFTFGHWMRQRRKAAALTQEALAALVPCSTELIRKIEAGTRHPAPRRAARLADCLDIPGEHRSAWLALARGMDVPAPALDRLRPPSTLPRPLTPLLGREAELATVRRRLDEAALVTLCGPPGVGKSRLALAVAADLRDTFPEGVFWVDLTALHSPAEVPLALALALQLDNVTAENAARRLRQAWREHRALVVLDNFEHLLAAAQEIGALVAACPWLKVLVTSRVALRLRGERRLAVEPLVVPSPDAPLPRIADSSAVRLFVERAREAQPDFRLDEGNAVTIERICVHLDGLPLALELAAAQLRLLDPVALLERLGSRELLRVESPVDARHHTLASAIASSVSVLAPDARLFFQRLAVFPASFTLIAAETVCQPGPHGGLVLAGTLVDAGLIYRPESGRLRLLQPLREFALEDMGGVEEAERLHERHADWILAEVERLAAELHGSAQVSAHAALEREATHVRAALAWLSGHDAVRGGRLAVALFWWWSVRGHLAEGCDWLDGCLSSPDLPDQLRAAALWRRGVLGLLQHEVLAPDLAVLHFLKACAEDALALQGSGEVHPERACALTLLAGLTHILGDPAAAEQRYQEALSLPGPPWVQRVARGYLAGLTGQARWVQEELTLAQSDGEAWAEADARHALALFQGMAGLPEPARTQLSEALALFRALGDRRRTAWTLVTAAGFARETQDQAAEQTYLQEALTLAREMGHPGWTAVASRALEGGPLPLPWL